MRQLSIRNKHSGVSNAFTHRKVPPLFNSVEPQSKGALIFRPLPHLVVEACYSLFRWVRTIGLQIAHTNQSEEEVSDEGGLNL